MESLDRKARIKQLILLKPYLQELSTLLGREVTREELSTLESVPSVNEFDRFATTATVTVSKEFSKRGIDELKIIFQKLSAANSSPICIWTEGTRECGILSVNSLELLDIFSFFTQYVDAVLSLSTLDMKDRVRLDITDEENGDWVIDITLQGESWGHLKI